MNKITKVLVANRGEIALRVMRTCKEMGIGTVAVYSEPDRTAPHALYADESVYIGEAASSKSYLVVDKIIDAAKKTGANAIHPGYGFLSENASFSQRCKDEGIIFIGPNPDAIESMGDKTRAREIMQDAGVPTPPGTKSALEDVEEARGIAHEIGFPVLVKAAAGGGGKGMRIIHKPEDFESGIKAAKSEAKNAFGDDRVYIEKYLEYPRHVEFQIIADTHGNFFHLYDRECSIQRRHQKVVEEAPCPFLTDELRQAMADAAVAAAKACNYTGAGTIEFLVDKHMNFYFLEMNTRLQVEHPVTEQITGFDLVALQIAVAQGDVLPFKQEDIQIKGHSLECRICAEDPVEQFMPSTGVLEDYQRPSGPGVRVDDGVRSGQKITIDYDPLMSKLVTFGKDRRTAINKMKRALDEYIISGVRTTIPFCKFVMDHPAFISADFSTHFVGDYFTEDAKQKLQPENLEDAAMIAAVLLSDLQNSKAGKSLANVETGSENGSEWWQRRLRRA